VPPAPATAPRTTSAPSSIPIPAISACGASSRWSRTVEDYFKQVDLKQGQKLQPGAALGDFIVDPLPPIDLGRIDAQSAKQVIFQKVRDAERERQYEEFKDRVGEIITGVVKSVEFGHVVVNLGRAEGVIRRDQQIPREVVRVGDRVRSLILNVRRENRGPQIFLSRAHPEFMKKLFAQEVPEIYDGIITIMAAARDPGSRAKIGVISRDGSIDPVGACVGMKGSRVQAVVQEMQGEKIDIIPWSRTPRRSSSTRSSPQPSAASSSTRTRVASRWWCRTISLASPSAVAARMSASPASSPARRSTS
jgi:transcription termination factor NusA